MRRARSNSLLVVILAAVACGADTDAPSQPIIPKLSKKPNTADSTLREQRAALDETIWKDEVAAQEFEATFVRLWDDLRNSEDAIEVLSAFPFSKLTLGVGGTPESLDLGITHWSNAADSRDLESGDWHELLTGFQQDGWELAQSEWHHTRFGSVPNRFVGSR